jgi:hypothetical protein
VEKTYLTPAGIIFGIANASVTSLLFSVCFAQTVQMGVDLAEYYYKEGVELDAVHILWIVQEFCNRGTLVDAGVCTAITTTNSSENSSSRVPIVIRIRALPYYEHI